MSQITDEQVERAMEAYLELGRGILSHPMAMRKALEAALSTPPVGAETREPVAMTDELRMLRGQAQKLADDISDFGKALADASIRHTVANIVMLSAPFSGDGPAAVPQSVCAYPNCTCSPQSFCLPEEGVKRAYDAALAMLHGTSADIGAGELDRTIRAALAAYTIPIDMGPTKKSVARFLCEEVEDRGVGSYDLCSPDRAAVYLDLAERLLFHTSTPPVGAETGEPAHLKFRREAFALAVTMDPADFAGNLDPVDENTVEGLARTLAIVAGGYEWTANDDGVVCGLVAGDHGYASTGLALSTSPAVPNTVGEDKLHGNDQASSAVASEVIDITDEYITKVLNGFHGTRYWLHMTKAEVRAALAAAKGAGE